MCGTWPPLCFRRKRIWNISHLGEPIVYILTKFRGNILTDGRDMRQNEIRNQPSGGGILFPVSILTTVVFWGPFSVSSCKISRKSLNARLSYCDSTFFLHALKPTLPKAQRYSAVMQAIYTSSSDAARVCRRQTSLRSSFNCINCRIYRIAKR